MISILVDAPAMVRVGCTFLAILVLNWAGLPLWLSVVLSAVGLSAWTGAGLQAFQHQITSILSPESLLLLLVILLLLFFTESLGVSGRISQTIETLRARLRKPRVLLAGLPALIGLLPMPGGALVSAPLVASVDADNGVSGLQKTAINYWFRHIWEYWWPLYPGVVLAIEYSRLPMATFYAIEMPLTLASILGGTFFILRSARVGETKDDGHRPRLRTAAPALIPIALLVTISVAGSLVLNTAGLSRTTANLSAMLIGLAAALFLVFLRSPGALPKSARMLRSRKIWSLLLVVLGVRMFSAALKTPLSNGEATLASLMGDELVALGIPLIAVMMVLPFIAGFVTGVAVGFVGISFPLVFGLLGENASLSVLASTTVLAYGAGYVGMMLSPIHICFVVTNEYFKSRLVHAYRYTLGPSVVVLLVAAALALLYRSVL